jgi:hypothetical protein
MQPHDQIARPPAHHAMDRSDRALLYDSGEKGLMALSLGGIPGEGILMRPSAPCSLNRILARVQRVALRRPSSSRLRRDRRPRSASAGCSPKCLRSSIRRRRAIATRVSAYLSRQGSVARRDRLRQVVEQPPPERGHRRRAEGCVCRQPVPCFHALSCCLS